jgi:hypothetical protein
MTLLMAKKTEGGLHVLKFKSEHWGMISAEWYVEYKTGGGVSSNSPVVFKACMSDLFSDDTQEPLVVMPFSRGKYGDTYDNGELSMIAKIIDSEIKPIDYFNSLADEITRVIQDMFQSIGHNIRGLVKTQNRQDFLAFISRLDSKFSKNSFDISTATDLSNYDASYYIPPHTLIANIASECSGILVAFYNQLLMGTTFNDSYPEVAYQQCVDVVKNTPQADWMSNKLVMSRIAKVLPKFQL